MEIYVNDRQNYLTISPEDVQAIVSEVIAFEGFQYDEAAIHLVSTEEICDLHDQFFDDPSPTDCISFPIDDADDDLTGYRVMGDVFVCTETAINYSKTKRGDQDPYKETTLYIVHGLLHLMGYDDIDPDDRLEMRAAEKRHMRHLKTLSLLLQSTPHKE